MPIISVILSGRMPTAETAKLAGIEALADVTDSTNVTAAGALMDSEVDVDIKTLVLPASTTISTFGKSLVDDADAGTARGTLDVDQAGTDNSDNNAVNTSSIARTTNIQSVNETGIADDEIALFNLTNKDIRSSNITIATALGADDTTVPTSKAVQDEGYTTNVGTVTSVAGGTGLTSTGGATPSISHDAHTSDVTGSTALTIAADAVDYTKATGSSKALTPVTGSTTGFAAGFTGANLYGGTYVVNSDDGDLQLPLMVAGMNFTITTLGAIEVVVDTNANDGYLMDGVTGAEGKNITNLSKAGDIAVLQYYTVDDWLITTNGWTAEA